MIKKIIKTYPAFWLYVYGMGTIFASCSSIKSSIGDLPNDIKREVLAYLPVEKIAHDMRPLNSQWRSPASNFLTQKKYPTEITIPGMQQLFMIDNMLKRIKTFRIRHLIINIRDRTVLPKQLDLTVDDFRSLAQDEQASANSLAGLDSLELDLSKSKMKDAEMRLLAQMPLSKTIRLDLSCNFIGDAGASALSEMHLPNIINLDLRKNIFWDHGAIALSRMDLSKINRLDLSYNFIGDQGGEAFSQMDLPKITRLDLSCNRIGRKGAEALSQMKLPNITALYASGNALTPSGVITLSQMDLPKITEIYVGGNSLGLNNADIQALHRDAGLKHIHVITGTIGHIFAATSRDIGYAP